MPGHRRPQPRLHLGTFPWQADERAAVPRQRPGELLPPATRDAARRGAPPRGARPSVRDHPAKATLMSGLIRTELGECRENPDGCVEPLYLWSLLRPLGRRRAPPFPPSNEPHGQPAKPNNDRFSRTEFGRNGGKTRENRGSVRTCENDGGCKKCYGEVTYGNEKSRRRLSQMSPKK